MIEGDLFSYSQMKRSLGSFGIYNIYSCEDQMISK